MTTMTNEPTATGETPPSLLAALVPHLPRMIAVSGVALAVALLGIQLIPQTYEARLPLSLAADTTPEVEAERFLTEEQLADVVSRLAPERVAELRANGGGALDSTALLRQRLVLAADPSGTLLNLTVTAPNAGLARAIAHAVSISHASLMGPPPLSTGVTAPTEQTAEVTPDPAAPADATHIQLLQQKLSFAWEDRVRLDGRAERIAGLVADGNYALLALEADGLPGLGRKLDQLASLEAEREKLSATLLPAHPTMRSVIDQIGTLSDEVSTEVASLVELVKADSLAARQLEENLRTELAAATAPKLVDTDMLTGSTAPLPELEVKALPRPVRTDLMLALVGGVAFFGQVGVFALRRRRPLGEDDIEVAEDLVPEEVSASAWNPVASVHPVVVAEPVVLPEPVPAPQPKAEPFWLTEARAQSVSVEAGWMVPANGQQPGVEPTKPAASHKDANRPAKATKQRAKAMDRLNSARIIALRSAAKDVAGGRELVSHLIEQGRRVVLVDAASRRRTTALGISDLSLGHAGFADIIHGSGLYEAAHIPWGREAELDTNARSVRILIQALSELYDVVVLMVAADQNPAHDALLTLAEETVEVTDLPGLIKKSA